MSQEKTTVATSSTPTMTPEEKALLQQQQQNNAFMLPYAQKNYAALSDNINAILTGGTPGAKGIGGIGDDQINEIVKNSLRDIPTSLQASGVLDSGAGQEYYGRQAANVRSGLAQFNTSAAQNLFNLAAGGQSNLQGQYQNQTNTMTNQLAGLRSINGTQTTLGMNPFLKSFQQGLGTSLGTGIGGGISGGLGGMASGSGAAAGINPGMLAAFGA